MFVGVADLRQLLTSDACRDLSRATSGIVRISTYWALTKYREKVDILRWSRMGCTLKEDLEDIHIRSSSSLVAANRT